MAARHDALSAPTYAGTVGPGATLAGVVEAGWLEDAQRTAGGVRAVSRALAAPGNAADLLRYLRAEPLLRFVLPGAGRTGRDGRRAFPGIRSVEERGTREEGSGSPAADVGADQSGLDRRLAAASHVPAARGGPLAGRAPAVGQRPHWRG